MKVDVITIGSATLDVFLSCQNLKTKKIESTHYLELGEKNNIDDVNVFTGGGATNTAATFRNIGFNVKSICSVGDDSYGHIIRKDLLSRGIKISMIQVKKNLKSGYSTILSTKKDNRAIFVFRGASRDTSHRVVNWKTLDANLIYISSLGGNMKLLSKAVMTAKQRNIPIAWNPGNQEISMGLENLKETLANIDYLILNSEEAETISGGSLFSEQKMYQKIKSYVKGLIIVTYGPKGAKIFDGKNLIYKKAIGEKRLDATGAGDAFGSGFTGMMLKTNCDIDESFEFALRNSGNVITELGAKNGLLKK